jgi:hypothetical protein
MHECARKLDAQTRSLHMEVLAVVCFVLARTDEHQNEGVLDV